MNIIAHAEELHTEATSSAEHLFTEPLMAIPLFILFAVGLYYGLTTLKVKPSTTMLIELTLFFAVGIATYSLIPALSIFALTIGIVVTLFVVLSSIAN